MAKRLFVGNLPYTFNDASLLDLFSQYGQVTSAMIVMDKFSGRSKGFGFVDMPNDEEAEKAIKELNDKEIEQRRVIVNEARPREERPRGDFDRRPSFGGGDRNRSSGGFQRDRGSRGSGSNRW